jgi:hypothetical protein
MKNNFEREEESFERIQAAMNPIFEYLEAGRPLPPMIHAIHRDDKSDYVARFRSLQDSQNVSEAAMVSNGSQIVRLICNSDNSYLRLNAEDFIIKYWLHLWGCSRIASSEVLIGLNAAEEVPNRENLYRILLSILRDPRRDSNDSEELDMKGLLAEVARDVHAANKVVPVDFSVLPSFMISTLPRASEYIVCAYALEYLVLRFGDDSQSAVDFSVLPILEKKVLENTISVFRHRSAFPDTSAGEVIRNEAIVRKIESWFGSEVNH